MSSIFCNKVLTLPTASQCQPPAGGVYEPRVRSEGAFRVFYVAKFTEAIYVVHAFEKKTQRTAGLDIEIGISGIGNC